MADNIAIEVEVNGVEKSINSIKDLKDAIKAAKDEQVKMASAFGEGSQEYLDATKKLSGLKDRVDDLNDSTQSLKGTGVEQLTQGFVQMKEGIMNLDFDKVKVGFTAMKSGIASFASSAKTALQGVKGALIATGIGALVVTLGVIVAYWDDIKGSIDGVSSEQKKLNELSKANLEAEQEKLKTLNSQDNILKLQGKTEKEILEYKIKQVDATYEAAEANLNNIILTQQAQVKAEEKNKEILTGVFDFTLKPLELISKGIDAVGDKLNKNLGLAEKVSGLSKDAANIDNSEAQNARKKELDEQIKLLTELKNQRAGYQLSIKKIDDDAAKEAAEKARKAAEEAKRLRDEKLAADLAMMKQIEDANIQLISNEQQRLSIKAAIDKQRRDAEIENSKASEEVKNQALLASEETFKNEMANIHKNYLAKKKADDDKAQADADALKLKQLEQENADNLAYAELRALRHQEDLDAQIALLEAQKNIELQNKDLTETEKALIEERFRIAKADAEKTAAEKSKQLELDKANATFDIAKQSTDSLQSLSDLYFTVRRSNLKKGSKEDLEQAKKQFNINKALAITSATISGIQGVVNALSAQSVVPEPFGTVLKVASAVAVGVAAAANIAKIASSKFDESGSGGGGASAVTSVPMPSPPTINTPSANTNQSTTFDETGKNLNQTTKPTINVNATVGVDEVSNKQNRVTALETQSTF